MLISSGAFSQDLKLLDDYISKIDHSIFTDTVRIDKIHSGNRVSIQGFFIDDSVAKAIIQYPELNRTREVYFKSGINVLNSVFYVKEYDSKTRREYIHIKSWNNKILESRFSEEIKDGENHHPKNILEQSDLSTEIEFKRVDDQADKYSFSGILTEQVELPAYCGIIAWASAFKFKIKRTDFKTKEKHLIILIQCPRGREEKFFEVGKLYEGIMATNSGVTFGWSILNEYENEQLPTFWARTIEKQLE